MAVVLALFIAALATTWRLQLSVTKDDAWRILAVLRMLDGHGPPISISGRRRKKKRKTSPSPSTSHLKRSRQLGLRGRLDILWRIIDILRCIHLRSARISARFGCADPAETGELFGLLASAIHAAPATTPVALDLEPVFDHQCLSGTASVEVSLRPIALVAPAVRLALCIISGARSR